VCVARSLEFGVRVSCTCYTHSVVADSAPPSNGTTTTRRDGGGKQSEHLRAAALPDHDGGQRQIEMFLGMQHARDFPSVPACGVHRVVSRPPSALLLKPTPAATATLLPQVEPQTRLDPIELDASGRPTPTRVAGCAEARPCRVSEALLETTTRVPLKVTRQSLPAHMYPERAACFATFTHSDAEESACAELAAGRIQGVHHKHLPCSGGDRLGGARHLPGPAVPRSPVRPSLPL
jgi:hypothetical protein